MKSFSKLFASLAAAGLLLAGCSSPTTTDGGSTGTPVVKLADFGAMTTIPASITVSAGENNLDATYDDLELTTDEAAQTNQQVYDYAASTKAWVDQGAPARSPEAKALKFTIKAVGPATEEGKNDGQNAYTVLTFDDVAFKGMASKTGVTFSIKETDLSSVGVQVQIRALGDDDAVNANAWTVNLNSVPNTNWDWVYFGDDNFIKFNVPFSKFVPASGAEQEQDTIAEALADGVVFDRLQIRFRMDTADNGALDTAYDAVIDNIQLY